MKGTLSIKRDNKIVNIFEFNTTESAKAELAKILYNDKFIKNCKTKLVRVPYVNIVKATLTWPNSETEKNLKYVYLFEDVEF